MVKKYTSEILLVNIILTVGLFVFCLFFNSKEEVVYVDSLRLFNDFKMTKEIMKIGDEELKRGKNHLDSLYVFLSNTTSSDEKEIIVKEIANTREILEQFQKKYSVESSEKIWKRINEYSSLYSQKNNYKMILGKQYDGVVIYGSHDVTDDILKYINKKYEGFK